MVEKFTLILFGKSVPVFFCSLKESECAHHIGACESERVLDRAIHVALSGEMYDSVDFVVLDDAAHFIKIGDISFHKCIVGAILDILKVGEVAGVCEFIEIEDMVLIVISGGLSGFVFQIGDAFIQRVGPVGHLDAELRLDLGLVENAVGRTGYF